MDILIAKSKENHLKITPQRIVIYKELLKSKDHPSSDVIYRKVRKRYPHISLDTVNRTLSVFADIGLASVVEGRGEPRRFDPITEEHGHFRCLKCNRIADFSVPSLDLLTIPASITAKFNVARKRLVLEGTCKRCGK